MGVNGLLSLLKSIQKHTNLKVYAGQTLGIDGFGWLHRGAFACAFQLALDKPTTQYAAFVVNRVRMLLDFGITPYIVFDGDALPSKSGTNSKRKQDRDAAKELGMSLWRAGKKEQAMQELQKAVSITPQMIHTVIEELRRMNVQILVAPYEADAQLVYLEKEGIIDGIISEDSDMLVFGATKLITKLDQHGSCIEVNRSDLILNREISFAGWSDTMFRRMAILSGCDYLPSVNGIGLRKGHELVKKHKEITRIARAMALQGKYVVPIDYVSKFIDAERAFLYHRVFCPKLGRLVMLNTLPPDLKEEDMPFLGPYIEPDVALGVACGDLNPKTKQPFSPNIKRSKSLLDTPRLQQVDRRSSLGPSDLKSKRSIDSFFKPQRTPLAELDPNSLTPSPSQQRLLERNTHASWEPRLANSAPPLRRVVTDQPRSTPGAPSNSGRTNFLFRAGAVSTYQPSKRQRMCSESDDIPASEEVKQSKYFAECVVQQSPLAKQKAKDRRHKKPAFDVFADDSGEGIITALMSDQKQTEVVYPEIPELDGHELEDDIVPQSSPIRESIPPIDSQSSHGTADLQAFSFGSQSQSQAQTPSTTQSQVSDVSDPEAFVELLDFHVKKLNADTKIRNTKRTFSGQCVEKQAAALASLKPPALEPTESSNEEVDSEESEHEELPSPRRSSTVKFQSFARTFACQSPNLQLQALKTLEKIAAPFHRADVSPLTGAKGSEDHIPFSSQDELSEAEEQIPAALNLKRFQYIGS